MLALIEQLREFEAALIAESMAAMGCREPEKYYVGSMVRRMMDRKGLTAGVALVLEADTSTPGEKPSFPDYWDCLTRITETEEPVMLIMKTVGSRPEHECVCGDGMCKALDAAGGVAIVTDGPVRDLEGISKTGIDIYASGTVTDHATIISYRWSQGPVDIGGVSMENGDLIIGDNDGVIKLPREYHAGIVEACLLSRDFESRVHTFWRRSDKSPAEKKEYATRLAGARDEECRKLIKG